MKKVKTFFNFLLEIYRYEILRLIIAIGRISGYFQYPVSGRISGYFQYPVSGRISGK
jgi:hypothetical protein